MAPRKKATKTKKSISKKRTAPVMPSIKQQKLMFREHHRLHASKLGLALGILSSIFILVTALWATLGLGGTQLVAITEDIYPGFGLDPLGIVAGMIWAFIDGFIVGWLLGLIYNKLL